MEGHEGHATGRLLGDPRLHPHLAPPGSHQNRLPVLDPQLPGVLRADLDRLLRPNPHDPSGAAGHGAAVVVLAPSAGGEDQRIFGVGHLGGGPVLDGVELPQSPAEAADVHRLRPRMIR